MASPESYYDSLAADYENVVRGWGYCMPEAVADAVQAAPSAVLGPEAKVLDLGCGDGMVGEALRRRGFVALCGADISAR